VPTTAAATAPSAVRLPARQARKAAAAAAAR
jgi:hypothetical protein